MPFSTSSQNALPSSTDTKQNAPAKSYIAFCRGIFLFSEYRYTDTQGSIFTVSPIEKAYKSASLIG